MQDCATNASDVQKHSVLLTWIAPCNATDVSFWYVPTTLHHLVNWGICMNCTTSTSNTVDIFVWLCTDSVCEKVTGDFKFVSGTCTHYNEHVLNCSQLFLLDITTLLWCLASDPSLDKSLNWRSESHKMNWSRGTCDNELKKSSNLILRSNVTMDLRLYRVKYPLHALMTCTCL